MNVGGCDVLNGFGDATQTGWDERRRYSTNVRWLALRPSQLDKFKTGSNAKSRKLSSKSFAEAFRFFPLFVVVEAEALRFFPPLFFDVFAAMGPTVSVAGSVPVLTPPVVFSRAPTSSV